MFKRRQREPYRKRGKDYQKICGEDTAPTRSLFPNVAVGNYLESHQTQQTENFLLSYSDSVSYDYTSEDVPHKLYRLALNFN